MMPTPNYRRGMTIMEATVVSGLLAVLAVLLSSTWVGVGKTAVDLIGRSQLVQERDLAIAAFSRDLGGSLIDPGARVGDKADGKWTDWEAIPSVSLSPNVDLFLTYSKHPVSGNTVWIPPDTTIQYHLAVDPNPAFTTYVLKRNNPLTGEDFLVARYLSSMTVTAIAGRPDAFNVKLVFEHGRRTLTCDLTAEIP